MEALLSNRSSLLVGFAVVILVMFLLRAWRRHFGANASERIVPQMRFARPRKEDEPEDGELLLQELPPEVSAWQVEMHDTAREMKAELDTKMAVLQRLILDARRESERLEAALKKSENLPKKPE